MSASTISNPPTAESKSAKKKKAKAEAAAAATAGTSGTATPTGPTDVAATNGGDQNESAHVKELQK